MKEKIAIEEIITQDESQEKVDNIVILKNNVVEDVLHHSIKYRGTFSKPMIAINVLELANHLFFKGEYKLDGEVNYDVENEMKRILEKGVQQNANKESE